MPPFQMSSDNISFDRGDEGFADARIVDISAAPITTCTTYRRIVYNEFFFFV